VDVMVPMSMSIEDDLLLLVSEMIERNRPSSQAKTALQMCTQMRRKGLRGGKSGGGMSDSTIEVAIYVERRLRAAQIWSVSARRL